MADTNANANTGELIASFDVGMKNLAYAVVHVNAEGGVGIVRWALIDLGEYMDNENDKRESLVPAVIRALDAADIMGMDVVLIENQPCMKNPRMKTVQVAIHAFFESMRHYMGPDLGVRKSIRLVNPSNKVGHGGKYSDRKREAIARCKEFLERELVDDNVKGMSRSAALDILAKAKKKDDLADAFLQALWFIQIPLKQNLKRTSTNASASA